MSPGGEDFEWIQKQCDLPHEVLLDTLKRLEDYKLVEITGSLQKPIYQLHRLTVQFLETRLKQDRPA
jgi:DNA-binding HxlR family transcriptional regulator